MARDTHDEENRPDLVERLARSSMLSFGAKWTMPERPTARQWAGYLVSTSGGFVILLGLATLLQVRGDHVNAALFLLMAAFYFSLWVLPKIVLHVRQRSSAGKSGRR